MKSENTCPPKKQLHMRTRYLILLLLWIVVSIGFIISMFIKTDTGIVDNAWTLVYVLFVYPICASIYGVLSYRITHKFLIPNLILYFTTLASFSIIFCIRGSSELSKVLSVSCVFPFILCSISSLFLGISILIKTHINKNQREK